MYQPQPYGPDTSYIDQIKAFFEKQRLERERRLAAQESGDGGGAPPSGLLDMFKGGGAGGSGAAASGGGSAGGSGAGASSGSSAAASGGSGYLSAIPWVAAGMVARNAQQKGTLGPDVKRIHALIDPAGDSAGRDVPKAAVKNPLKFIFPHENATKNLLGKWFGWGKK